MPYYVATHHNTPIYLMTTRVLYLFFPLDGSQGSLQVLVEFVVAGVHVKLVTDKTNLKMHYLSILFIIKDIYCNFDTTNHYLLYFI